MNIFYFLLLFALLSITLLAVFLVNSKRENKFFIKKIGVIYKNRSELIKDKSKLEEDNQKLLLSKLM